MPRRRKLPPDIDPKRPHSVVARGPKQQCPHCLGWTKAVKGQSLDEAVAIHLATCPAVHRINPFKKGH